MRIYDMTSQFQRPAVSDGYIRICYFVYCK